MSYFSYLAVNVALMFNIVHLLLKRCLWNSLPIRINANLPEFDVEVSINFFPHLILVGLNAVTEIYEINRKFSIIQNQTYASLLFSDCVEASPLVDASSDSSDSLSLSDALIGLSLFFLSFTSTR